MNHGLRLALVLLSLCIASCNSDFTINAPYQVIYVLNCIVRDNQSIQYAFVSKNIFTENGVAPADNSIPQYIKGVTIKIYNNDSVFVMRDTTIQVPDAGSGTAVNCYYVKNLILTPGNATRIEALVPDGTLLTSTLQVPQISFDKFPTRFPLNVINYYATPFYGWSWVGNASVLNIPQLEVYYKHMENGVWVENKILVPLVLYNNVDDLNHVNDPGTITPVNGEFSFINYCLTTIETLNKTMQDISGNDPYKKNYCITKVEFSVLGMDPVLTRYYSASQSYAEEFTIKLRPTDITNIEGGKGIFGEYHKYSQALTIDSVYVRSFGYQYNP